MKAKLNISNIKLKEVGIKIVKKRRIEKRLINFITY